MTQGQSAQEKEEKPCREKRGRGIYLLPNLFTTAALFSGFYAVVAAIKGQFEIAAIAVFVAMVMDGLDGRVARLTNTQSAFGAEYDSLADMVSFGLVPALIVYLWALSTLGKVGWLVAFIYTASAALRLARFNTQVGSADRRYFQGLPSPAAAAVVMGMIWVGVDYGFVGEELSSSVAWIAAVITAVSGLLMVSNIRYHSLKELDFKNRVPFVVLLLVVAVYVVISIDPPQILFGIFFLYLLWGPLFTLVELRKRRAERSSSNKV